MEWVMNTTKKEWEKDKKSYDEDFWWYIALKPRATEEHTVEELTAMGLVGIYRKKFLREKKD